MYIYSSVPETSQSNGRRIMKSTVKMRMPETLWRETAHYVEQCRVMTRFQGVHGIWFAIRRSARDS